VPRPFRAWGHPFTTGLALLASFAFLVAATFGDLHNSLWSMELLLASIPVYFLMQRKRV